eukprot:7845156-Alexandrium_andersonii.AAC.1
MSASLVGSEMCISDRFLCAHHGSCPPKASMYNQPVRSMVWVCGRGAQNWNSRRKCRACQSAKPGSNEWQGSPPKKSQQPVGVQGEAESWQGQHTPE